MNIFRKSLFIVLLLSFLSLNAWGVAPPSIVSSSPSDLQIVSPATLGITVHFSETMTGSGYWSFSSLIWQNSTSDWSADRRTFSIVRNNVNDPLPEGSYWFRFNPAGHPDFESDATGLPLPTTTVHFTVSNNGQNNGDVTPPHVVSSQPVNGITINQSINSITINFDEAMAAAGINSWSVSNNAWGNSNLTSLSGDRRSMTILRQGMNIQPLTDGVYTFTLNPANAGNPLTDTAGNQLARTTITFTLNSNANPPAGDKTYYIPYFKSDAGGWWTGVGISNNNTARAALVTATIFGQTGNTLSTSNPPVGIVPNGQFSGTLGNGLNTTGWIKITSNNELSGLCFTGLSLMADIPFVTDLSSTLLIPHVAQDADWDTSLMVCNPNNTSVSLRLTYFTKEGQAHIFTPPAPISASGSAVYELGTAFAAALPIRGGKVVLSVTQGGGIAAFALYSNRKTGHNNFAGISAIPIAPIANPINPF